jgi:hypothetical protein
MYCWDIRFIIYVRELKVVALIQHINYSLLLLLLDKGHDQVMDHITHMSILT